jgi:hypothetical protein
MYGVPQDERASLFREGCLVSGEQHSLSVSHVKGPEQRTGRIHDRLPGLLCHAWSGKEKYEK